MYKAKVNVTLKKSVLDPQGKTVLHALHSIGFDQAQDVRVGKFFEVNLAGKDRGQAETKLKEMCDRLLINPVIEDYSFEISEE